MKLIIDIPEREYKVICENNYVAVCACPNLLSNAIKNGTPIPNNATNGEIIQTLFEPNRIERANDDVIVEHYDFNKEWWNASYKSESEE